jgi:hypothetical protein
LIGRKDLATMASPTTEFSDAPSGARTPPTADELSQAFAIEVYDREGKTKTLGELVKGQKSVLVFIRHFCKSTRVKKICRRRRVV